MNWLVGRTGAVERTNLEPAQLLYLLEELEEWGSVLKSDPEVIHRLDAFAAAAGSDGSACTPNADQPVQLQPDALEPGL